MAKSVQVAAVPVRRTPGGGIEVLLVTSRDTQRWVVPKGWPWRNVTDNAAAAGEAWEEAGVRGTISTHSIGTFRYAKRHASNLLAIEVRVFLLEVTEVADTWPEVAERRRGWFSPIEAAARVAEPELQAILRSLDTGSNRSE